MDRDICTKIFDIDFIIKKNYNANCRYTVADKDSYRIMYVKSGSALLRFPRTTLTAQKGDIIILAPHSEYVLCSCGNESWSFAAVAFFASSLLPFGQGIIKPRNPAKYESALDNAFDIWQQRPCGYRLLIMGIIYSMLFDILQETEKSPAVPNIEKAKNHILTNYGKKLSLTELAAICGYSVSYFKAHFTKNVGISPMRYLTNVRMERAKELLRTGLYSVGEVAKECGFDNLYYFSNAFKKHTGIRPSDY